MHLFKDADQNSRLRTRLVYAPFHHAYDNLLDHESMYKFDFPGVVIRGLARMEGFTKFIYAEIICIIFGFVYPKDVRQFNVKAQNKSEMVSKYEACLLYHLPIDSKPPQRRAAQIARERLKSLADPATSKKRNLSLLSTSNRLWKKQRIR